jgi:two-component system, NarL family, sensor histidine kinase LiaS
LALLSGSLERQKQLFYQDLHDGIGTDVANISIASNEVQLLVQNEPMPERLQDALLKLSRAVQISAHDIDDMIWVARSREETLRGLLARLRQRAGEMLDIAGLRHSRDFPIDLADRPITPELSQNLLMILKEALANIAKHAQARRVAIQARVAGDELVLTIQDDGSGIEEHIFSHSDRGIENIKSRVKRLDGTFTCKSKNGQGAELVISIPLPKARLSVER